MLLCFPHPWANGLDHRKILQETNGGPGQALLPTLSTLAYLISITSCLQAKVFRECYLELYFSITRCEEAAECGVNGGMPVIPLRLDGKLSLGVEIITTHPWSNGCVADDH